MMVYTPPTAYLGGVVELVDLLLVAVVLALELPVVVELGLEKVLLLLEPSHLLLQLLAPAPRPVLRVALQRRPEPSRRG